MDRPSPTIRELYRCVRCRALTALVFLVYPRPGGPPTAICAACAVLPGTDKLLMLLARPFDRDAPEGGDDRGDR